MKHYELTYVVPVKFAGDELEKVQEKIRNIIKKEGGEIDYEEDLGKKKLAYQIQHNSQGFYIVNEFDLDPSKLSGIENKIVLTAEIIRHLVVAKDKMNAEERKVQKIKVEGKNGLEKKSDMSDQFNIENQLDSQDKKEAKSDNVVVKEKVVEPIEVEEVISSKKEVAEKKSEIKKSKKEDNKVNLEDLDKKLDEIIDSNLF